MLGPGFVAVGLICTQQALAQLPNGWFGYQNARWSECTNFISTCKPTKSTCAKYLCQQCYSMGGAGFKECCNQPTPYVCFDQAEGGGNQDITTAPPSVTNAQQRACQTAGDMMLSCESATSGFDSLDDSDAASCLCYSNTHWQPKSFDQPFSSCIAWASTADTSDYVNWNSMRGFCSSVGDVMKNGPASASATTTAATDGATASAKNSAGMVKPSMAILMGFPAAVALVIVGTI